VVHRDKEAPSDEARERYDAVMSRPNGCPGSRSNVDSPMSRPVRLGGRVEAPDDGPLYWPGVRAGCRNRLFGRSGSPLGPSQQVRTTKNSAREDSTKHWSPHEEPK
jgi:hypothetical protein